MPGPNKRLIPSSLSDAELIRLRAAVQNEVKRRGLAFSVGDIGEELAIKHFRDTPGLSNLQHAPRGTKNVDALSRGGDRYSIKTIWKAKKTGTIYPDTENPERQLFEYLIIVQLNDSLDLAGLWRFDWPTFCDVRKWDKRMSAWYVACGAKTLSLGEMLKD